jgi:hypothetical protein
VQRRCGLARVCIVNSVAGAVHRLCGRNCDACIFLAGRFLYLRGAVHIRMTVHSGHILAVAGAPVVRAIPVLAGLVARFTVQVDAGPAFWLLNV